MKSSIHSEPLVGNEKSRLWVRERTSPIGSWTYSESDATPHATQSIQLDCHEGFVDEKELLLKLSLKNKNYEWKVD